MRPFDGRRILLVVSGGISAYKSVILVRRLREAGAAVDVLMTGAAERFVGPVTFEALAGRPVHRDLWERPLAHIELGRDADLAIVAPATADLLSAMAQGRAGDLASATLLAAACPVLACPAMNSRMWRHPATRANVELLRARGVHLCGPEDGPLAEDETGPGRMAEPERILREAGRRLEAGSSLAGRKVVVTAGPTRSAVDPVRYLGNRSTGRMGFELAASAWRRGAEVVCIHGPGAAPPPLGPRLVPVETTRDMLRELETALDGASVLLMAAAVGDFEIAEPRPEKWRKEEAGDGSIALALRRTPDLLEETREARKTGGVLTLAFALETERDIGRVRRKLERKGADLIALNLAGRPGEGFEADTNRVTLVDADGNVDELPLLPKPEVADRLLDRLEARLRPGS
ncbi:MAG: bifunctional phosphopantothenoylcysteine decarboxylase/phosphopantothenate--cysteine ligase CoaBC [Gemmatimonadota bacterium]|nr:bifunctional phosphopantothenoylcysteine decarboxylase/phosphopantothenate--cysteine ligase CoaBC [Gemmatimonadota bacterium]